MRMTPFMSNPQPRFTSDERRVLFSLSRIPPPVPPFSLLPSRIVSLPHPTQNKTNLSWRISPGIPWNFIGAQRPMPWTFTLPAHPVRPSVPFVGIVDVEVSLDIALPSILTGDVSWIADQQYSTTLPGLPHHLRARVWVRRNYLLRRQDHHLLLSFCNWHMICVIGLSYPAC